MASERVAALIVKNKKLLLVTGYDESIYWTPGGKIEQGESFEGCLKREVFEELRITITKAEKYTSKEYFNPVLKTRQVSHYFLVEFEGKVSPSKEISKIIWYSKENLAKKQPKISEIVEEEIIPQMIKEGLL